MGQAPCGPCGADLPMPFGGPASGLNIGPGGGFQGGLWAS